MNFAALDHHESDPSHGPLSADPAPSNYRIEGPPHRLFFDDFPRRVRALFGSETVFDTRRGKLLHETGLLPQLYVPRDDVGFELLAQTEHTTHRPFKSCCQEPVARADRKR